jgi:flagellar hook-associated protein 2
MMSVLGAGSGIDTKTLAQNLVDAEKAPQKALIDKKISDADKKVSGFAAVNFVLSQVKDAFAAMNDATEYAAIKVDNSNTAAFSVAASASAESGARTIKVDSLVAPQRSLMGGFSDTTTAISASDFTITLTTGGTATAVSITAATSSPADIVDAINDSAAGVTAKLVNTGDATNPYKILLTGQNGSAKAFTMSTDLGAGLSMTAVTEASDARVTVDGISYTRTNNKITDIVPGLTITLNAKTSATETVNISRDSSGLKDKVKALVTAYNDAVSMFNVVTDPGSQVETYGATLVGDSTVRTIRTQLRNIFSGTSNTPSNEFKQMWQMGVTVNKDGQMELDETKFDSAVESNFDDMVKMMTGNLNNVSVFSTRPVGLAGEAVKTLTKMTASTGLAATQSDLATKQKTKYQADLTRLEDRMMILLERYTKQFSVMDSLVNQTNSLKTSLKSTFEGMSKSSD